MRGSCNGSEKERGTAGVPRRVERDEKKGEGEGGGGRPAGARIQKERPIERALYDWTFRAFLRKGRAGTRVLLAKTKERRLDGGPLKTGPETVRRRLFMRRTAEKDVSPRARCIPAFGPARPDRDIICRGYNRRVLGIVGIPIFVRAEKGSAAFALARAAAVRDRLSAAYG